MGRGNPRWVKSILILLNIVLALHNRNAIRNYETLHPHNISEKKTVMLEYFRSVTVHKIDGKAKAMTQI